MKLTFVERVAFQGHVMSLSQQIRNFEKVTLPDLEAQLGYRSRVVLPNYLFVVGTGGNDYSFNYFLMKSNSNVSLQAFTTNLTSSLSEHLKVMFFFFFLLKYHLHPSNLK
jgi:hypothetical protein